MKTIAAAILLAFTLTASAVSGLMIGDLAPGNSYVDPALANSTDSVSFAQNFNLDTNGAASASSLTTSNGIITLLTGGAFAANASSFTSYPFANLAGTASLPQLPSIPASLTTNFTLTVNGIMATGTVANAAAVTGSQSNLIATALQSVPAGATNQFAYTNDSRAVSLNNAGNTFTGSFTGNGSGLTNLPASGGGVTTNNVIAIVNSGQTAAVTNGQSGVSLPNIFLPSGGEITGDLFMFLGIIRDSLRNDPDSAHGSLIQWSGSDAWVYSTDGGSLVNLQGSNVVGSLTNNTTGNAGGAANDSAGNNIAATYLPSATAATTYAPITVTNLTSAQLAKLNNSVANTYTFQNTNLNAGIVITNGWTVFVGTNLPASGNLTNVFIYKMLSFLSATNTTPSFDAGYILQPGTYSYTANLNAAAMATTNGVYAVLNISNTAAVSDSAMFFNSFSGGVASSNSFTINNASAFASGRNGPGASLLAVATVSSGSVGASSFGSGVFTLITPATFQYGVVTSSGTVPATTPAIVLTNSTAVFTKIQ